MNDDTCIGTNTLFRQYLRSSLRFDLKCNDPGPSLSPHVMDINQRVCIENNCNLSSQLKPLINRVSSLEYLCAFGYSPRDHCSSLHNKDNPKAIHWKPLPDVITVKESLTRRQSAQKHRRRKNTWSGVLKGLRLTMLTAPDWRVCACPTKPPSI